MRATFSRAVTERGSSTGIRPPILATRAHFYFDSIMVLLSYPRHHDQVDRCRNGADMGRAAMPEGLQGGFRQLGKLIAPKGRRFAWLLHLSTGKHGIKIARKLAGLAVRFPLLSVKVSRVDFALDLIYETPEDAERMGDWVCGRIIRPYHRCSERVIYYKSDQDHCVAEPSSGTRYTDRASRSGLVVYSDLDSRICGSPCVHIERRFLQAQNCRRQGVGTLEEILAFEESDHLDWWRRGLVLEDHEPDNAFLERLGRLYANEGHRRQAKIRRFGRRTRINTDLMRGGQWYRFNALTLEERRGEPGVASSQAFRDAINATRKRAAIAEAVHGEKCWGRALDVSRLARRIEEPLMALVPLARLDGAKEWRGPA